MLSEHEFIQSSVEINLFFQRIMKEHLFFIETNLQPIERGLINEARILKENFEELLAETTYYANYIVTNQVIESHELVTPYTLKAEEITSKLTGANINTLITDAELQLSGSQNNDYTNELHNLIYDLNNRTLNLLNKVITFKEKILNLSLNCSIFITVYDEMIVHDINEAKHYQKVLNAIQNKKTINETICNELNFWNHIMEEHALFIDGMLDPTENTLKKEAKSLANNFEKLVKECIDVTENLILNNSINSVENLRNYKITATEKLINCNLKSIIPPLLADHVLREANHYLRLLKTKKDI